MSKYDKITDWLLGLVFILYVITLNIYFYIWKLHLIPWAEKVFILLAGFAIAGVFSLLLLKLVSKLFGGTAKKVSSGTSENILNETNNVSEKTVQKPVYKEIQQDDNTTYISFKKG